VPALAVLRVLGLYFAYMLAATSALSLPLASATLLAVKTAPAWAVAATGAGAAALSAIFDWHFVRRVFRAQALDRVRRRRLFARAEAWAKVAPFWTTVVFAALPVPFAIARVLMPLSGYPLRRYVAATALGRVPRLYMIAAFGMLVEIPTPVLVVGVAGGVLVVGAAALARRLGWLGASRDGARGRGVRPGPPQ
jgi:uncharacterized membrane protein YdjX (TVP38/TMEM64 family)